MLLIAPAFSLVAIAVTVRSSAKAKTVEEAQQRAVFLIFPILALVIGQFTGILLINSWLLLGLGAVLVVLDVLLMRNAAGNFTYEKLLISWCYLSYALFSLTLCADSLVLMNYCCTIAANT